MMFLHFYICLLRYSETKRGSKFAVVLDSAMAPKQQQSFFAARKEGALKVKSHEKLHGFRGDFFDPFQVVYRYIYIYIHIYYTFGIYDFMYRIYTGFQLWNYFVLVRRAYVSLE